MPRTRAKAIQKPKAKNPPGRRRTKQPIASDADESSEGPKSGLPDKRRRRAYKKRKARNANVKYTAEELEERRFNEVVQRLCAREEILRQADVRDHGSDDEGVARVDVGIDGESDEEEPIADDMCNKEGEVKCPRPAPRKGRGGHKFLKRNLDVEVSQDEVREMCTIIRSTMRRSLTSNNMEDIIQNDGSDSDSDEEYTERLKKVPVEKPGADVTVYRHLWRVLDAQDQWLNEKTKAYSACPEAFAAKLCSYHMKNGLMKQLTIEHLSWVSIEGVGKRWDGEIAKNGVLGWLPHFQRKYSARYPTLLEDGRPGSKSVLDDILKVATLQVTSKINQLLDNLIAARGALLDLVGLTEKVYYDKDKIIEEFEEIHDALSVRNAKFDESSVWGLKPIRLALEPPYFKSEDGLMAAPFTSDAVERDRVYPACFFKRDKQKWTTKDLKELKKCIKEALYTKRLELLRDRYDDVMIDCYAGYDAEMADEGRFRESFNRSIGRPKKSELELSDRHGAVYPVIAVLPNGIVIRSRVTPRMAAEWRAAEEKKLKAKSYEELVFMENGCVDWAAVSNKMVLKSRKQRTAEDCELAWRHEVHPDVNDKRWTVEESRRLKEIYTTAENIDWFAVANELNAMTSLLKKPGRTAYQCYFRVRNRIDPPKKLCWNETLDKQVLAKLQEHPGNWRVVAASLDNPSATKRQVIERYKKTINPVLRNGAFTRVEDCLLILTIEKLKPFLAREGHFGCLLSYLPWRCETTWRDRANNLFSDWIVPWTLEEDKMLLQLAVSMKRNWQKISEEFTSFKNRKGCLTRYKILKRRLKDKRFNNSLEAYHEAYAMTRYNVFQYKHLKEMLELLLKVQAHPLPKEHQNFVGLLQDRQPSEVRLQHMLLTFDKEILESTINSLSRYVRTRDDYWRNWINLHGQRKRTFDRRTFHPENPQSVASALHIRGLELKNKDDIHNISDFENEIFKFYARFRRTKALNQETKRPYIPDAKTLAKWSAVSRLIATPLDQLEDVPVKRKWKSLQPDDEENPNKKARGRKSAQDSKVVGRRQKIRDVKKNTTKKESKADRLITSLEAVPVKRNWNCVNSEDEWSPVKKAKGLKSVSGSKVVGRKRETLNVKKKTAEKRSKPTRKYVRKALVATVSNEDGYLLIPHEKPRLRRGRSRNN